MALSVFDVFKIGLGPSSSHTVGPMVAARRFAETVAADHGASVGSLKVELFGSLALTGRGHGTDRAVMLGLEGHRPDQVCPEAIDGILGRIAADGTIRINGCKQVGFDPAEDLIFKMDMALPFHPNAMRLYAFSGSGSALAAETFYSVGGGFVVSEAETNGPGMGEPSSENVPYPFDSAAELLDFARRDSKSIAQIVMANEITRRSRSAVCDGIDRIWHVMNACIDRGAATEGVLPGGLRVSRRAPILYKRLVERQERVLRDPMSALDYVNLWAIAVNEENAAGSRVVTSPTNGAAGIIPAVLRYYERFCDYSPKGIHTFFLTAAAIAHLFKRNASISGAEAGCQGEVGVACSMAAAGLAAAQGGANEQIENAAEIAMEHNLGLTCDPIGGLVQIPCIERNAMGAIKAIDAARLALTGDGSHRVSLDQVIATMRETGRDMSSKYKETSQGGLAVNVPEC